ncbi:hypothetical protein I2I11_16370 [Pontibacter sp. 172403-2]|uniref:hypothetical protein n=1 Tax=Pontibacter rufus TaxID=2791028 RepID=UPI0018AF8430|nr:hypothetical protein [Pontibacter sp. 172403-2]MBF9254879.1 hypothetical protein [Pontibacter sp. 172403-2]
MEELKILARLVTSSKRISNYLPNEKKESKEGLFLANLRNNNYSNDADAAFDLYKAQPDDVRYKMLKHRLRKKLYNRLLFMEYPKLRAGAFMHKENECFQLLHHVNILITQPNYNLVLSLTSRILATAEEFDLTNISIAALELRLRAYSEQGLLKQFNETDALLTLKLHQKAYERKAVSLFQYIKTLFNKSIKARKAYLPNLPEDIKRLHRYWKAAGTFDAFNSFYKVSILYYESIGEFSKIADLTVVSEKLVNENSVNKLRFDSNFNKFILVYAHLLARKLEDGLLYAEEYLNNFNERLLNWFAYMENYFLLAVHSRRYKLAHHLISKVYHNNAFARTSGASKERWGLYSAYLHLYCTEPIPAKPGASFFDITSSPEYSKDKQGYNVAILILQFIIFLKKGDKELLLYKIESLKKYINTHLKDAFSLRSKTFLKLLILTVTEDFDAVACKAKGERLYQKLIQTPPPGDAYAEIEIVPYEHLWEHILSILEEKH